jgi:hypothetical protein
MHVAMYDSNPQEWSRSTIEPKSKEMTGVAFEVICQNNDESEYTPIGPKKLIERDGHAVVIAAAEGGHETETILYVLSAEEVDDSVLDSLVTEFCPVDEEDEEFDDE